MTIEPSTGAASEPVKGGACTEPPKRPRKIDPDLRSAFAPAVQQAAEVFREKLTELIGERHVGPVWIDADEARHWIDRYAAGIDEEPQLDRILDCVGLGPKVQDHG